MSSQLFSVAQFLTGCRLAPCSSLAELMTQTNLASSYVVIPARLASTRLARKLLLRETGKSVLQHTYEAAQQASRPREVWVATDHEEIAAEVERFGGKVQLTDPAARTGTDRVAELAGRLPEVDIVVNVQGDEPEISPDGIDLAIELLERDSSAVMSTLATPIRSPAQLKDPACVKVVCDQIGRALYFSRGVIPHARSWNDALLHTGRPNFLQHVGLYAYRKDFLLQLSSLPASELETIEQLEQLRVLSAGYSISVGIIEEPSIGIDTAEDYRAFVERFRQRTMP